MNHISLNGEVVAQKLGSISVVGHDAAHFGRRQEYVLRPFRSEERRNRALVGQVQLGTTAQQQIARALPLKTTNQGGPDEAAMAGAFVHGAAGDLWAEAHGDRGLLAGEIAELVPDVLSTLGNRGK